MHTLIRPSCQVRRRRPVRLPVESESPPASFAALLVVLTALSVPFWVLAAIGAATVFSWLMN